MYYSLLAALKFYEAKLSGFDQATWDGSNLTRAQLYWLEGQVAALFALLAATAAFFRYCHGGFLYLLVRILIFERNSAIYLT